MNGSTDTLIAAPTDPLSGQRRTFLLIDDESMVGRLLADAAEECGCEAVRTLTMASFQRSFEDRRPDIVAVDLCVPGYDGIEILRFLAAEHFPRLVLIVSGLDQRILSSALRLGTLLGLNMAEPLAKPFRLDELAQRLGVEQGAGLVEAGV